MRDDSNNISSMDNLYSLINGNNYCGEKNVSSQYSNHNLKK